MISKRQRRLAATKELKKGNPDFEQIDLCFSLSAPEWCTRAFRNNKYHITINDDCMTTHGKAIRVMVQRHTDLPILNHWSEMQYIKNTLFGRETVAVEYYPAESQLLNDHNIYWMFIYPEGVLPIPL